MTADPNSIRPAATPSTAGAARRADIRLRDGRKVRRGFSLLELVIVLAIMSTLAAIGIFRYAGALARYRVDAACARLIADLRLAQTQARVSSSQRTVRFIPARNAYEIFSDAQLAANAPGTTVSLADDPYRVTIRVDGLPGNQLAFNGRGEGNGGGIVVLSVGTAERAVLIEPNFGRAYVAGAEN